MKIYDGPKVVAGLVIFLLVCTFPFWINIKGWGRAAPAPNPKSDTPLIKESRANQQCIQAPAWMKVNHTRMLNQWRTMAVRDGVRTFAASNGQIHEMSLTRTCMSCHANKRAFCDECHTYAGVTPDCWTCHIVPKENA